MTTNNSMTLGERLRYVRTTCGLSIAEVSKKINVPEKEILENESDKRPSFKVRMTGRDYELLNWYSSLYGCSFNYLMGWSDYPFGVPARVQIDEKLNSLSDEQLEQLLQFLNLYYKKS